MKQYFFLDLIDSIVKVLSCEWIWSVNAFLAPSDKWQMAYSKCPVVYVNIYTVDDKYVPFHRFQQLPIETVLRDKGAIENEG